MSTQSPPATLLLDRLDTSVKSRLFPGWWMLGVAAAAQFMSGPGQSYSIAAFKDPMRTGLGISETHYSLAYGFATLLSGLSLPFVGHLVDRIGARRVLPVIAALLGAACLWMSHTTTLPGLYVGFSMVRCLGQGALTLVSMWIVGEWFSKRRGLAASIAGLGGSLSVMIFPLLNSFLISHFDWRTGWSILAIAVWLVLILPTIVFLRDRPEDIGLHPDGITPTDLQATPPDVVQATGHEFLPTEYSWSVGEALRDVTFWRLLSVPAASGMVITGLIFHQVAVLGSRGVKPFWALGLISLQAVVATIFSLPAGWLTDRLAGRHLLSAAMLLLAAASLTLLIMPLPQLAILYAVLLGLHGSILRSTGNVIWLNYYGRTHQGSIRGVMMAVMILAAAVGPLPFAFSIDRFGSYDLPLLFFIAIPLVAAAIVSTTRAPRPPTEREVVRRSAQVS